LHFTIQNTATIAFTIHHCIAYLFSVLYTYTPCA
jgi:hypothetical protein